MSTHAARNRKENGAICVLTIGGLDPSGGAGLTADARAQAAFGAHCCPVATAVIAQNTRGVFEIEPVSPRILAAQIDRLLEDIAPRAVKIGMVPGLEHARVIAARLRLLRDLPIIIDTVFAPSAGPGFADDATVRYIAEQWLPLCDIVTPNTIEAARLCGAPVDDLESMKRAAGAIAKRFGPRHVLVKGGHLPLNHSALNVAVTTTSDINPTTAATANDAIKNTQNQSDALVADALVADALVADALVADALVATDILFDGATMTELRANRVAGYGVRGTGCLLASALAAQRARDVPVEEAARRAKVWLTQQIRTAKAIGGGSRVAFDA